MHAYLALNDCNIEQLLACVNVLSQVRRWNCFFSYHFRQNASQLDWFTHSAARQQSLREIALYLYEVRHCFVLFDLLPAWYR